MLQGLIDTIFQIIGMAEYESWMEMFAKEGDVLLIMVLTACILILLTVSFAFKFLLKLVER